MPQRACIKAFHAAWVRDHTVQTTRRRMVKGVAEGVKAREVATEAARAKVTVEAVRVKVTVEAARSGATSADMSRAACPPSRPAGRQPWFVAAAVWSELTRAGAAAKAAVCSVLSEPRGIYLVMKWLA